MSSLATDSTARASTNTGQSDEAQLILAKAAIKTSDAVTFAKQLDTTIALFEACATAAVDGWDGPGSRAVPLHVYLNAEKFTNSLPHWMPTPEIGVYRDGEIEFEWYCGPGRVFAVSVGETDMVHFAGLFGAQRAHGRQRFVEDFPQQFTQYLSRIGIGLPQSS